MATAPSDRVLVALDTPDAERAAALAQGLAGACGGVKLGQAFFTANGPAGVARVAEHGLVFLDLKFHDIPNTLAAAVRAVLPLRPFMLTVHAAGGAAMMKAAAEAAAEAGEARPLVVGVTVLTSLDDGDLRATGVTGGAAAQAERLARLAQGCGLDGVVCSAHEAAALRRALGADFVLVVPGIRPAWAAADDQKRAATPAAAMAAGADYLVVGRPVTGAADPVQAARRIAAELA